MRHRKHLPIFNWAGRAAASSSSEIKSLALPTAQHAGIAQVPGSVGHISRADFPGTFGHGRWSVAVNRIDHSVRE
jgi:hypothetical protein